MVLMVSQSCLLIHLFLKRMYQLLISNWPTTKFILFTTKIIIFRIYFKRKYASTNKKTVFMYCCMTFVTKNKYLLTYVRSFLLLCFFRSFFLSYFTRFNFPFIIVVTSDNTTALIDLEPRIGTPRSMLQFIFLYCKAFLVPKNPNVYIILSKRMNRMQTLFRKFAGTVEVKFRKRL
jgi:hypothetical protein